MILFLLGDKNATFRPRIAYFLCNYPYFDDLHKSHQHRDCYIALKHTKTYLKHIFGL